MNSSLKLSEKKIELKKLFTIDSILCVNQKDQSEFNENCKPYDVVKVTVDNNQRYQQQISCNNNDCSSMSLKKTTTTSNEMIRSEINNDRSNLIKKNEDDFSTKYYFNNSDLNKATHRYSEENSKTYFKTDNKQLQTNSFSNSLFLNKKFSDTDVNKKNATFSSTFVAEDLTSKAESLKHFICSTINNKNSKLIKENPFEVTNEGAMQCIIQSANQQEYQQNNFPNNFQYCFPRLLTSAAGQNFTNGFQANSFLNYNQLMAFNSGKND